MRRYSFFIGAASAVLTFVALSAFTGRRPWNRESRWPYGWHRHHCDRDGRYYHERAEDSSRWHQDRFPPAMPIDSAGKAFDERTDSTQGR